jgi:hypothetical protein
MWERRAWWVNEDPPPALTVLSSGEWYLTPHGVENIVSRREHVIACIVATPLLLSSMVALRDALLEHMEPLGSTTPIDSTARR